MCYIFARLRSGTACVNESKHNNNVPAMTEVQRLPVLEDEARWEEAAAKMALVKQVLGLKGGLSQAIAAVAAESGVGQRTLWYWLKAYRTHGITGLLDNRGRHLKGKSRLHPEAEKLTADVIASRGLTKQKRKPRKVHDALIQACVNNLLELQPPSYTTVRRRMAAVQPRDYIAAREGAKAARERFDPVQHSRHTELGCTPYERWHSVEPYRHSAELDETLVNILFLPFRQVTVTRAGIRLFNMVYQADVLRRWIGVKRDDLFVNYDPRDMSRVYFFDPDLERYFVIACHDMRMPAPTLAQVQGVAKTIRRKGERISPQRLADALNRLDAMVSEAETKAGLKPGTKTARRKREAAKRPADTTPVMAAEKTTPVLTAPVDDFADEPVSIYRAEIMRSGK